MHELRLRPGLVLACLAFLSVADCRSEQAPPPIAPERGSGGRSGRGGSSPSNSGSGGSVAPAAGGSAGSAMAMDAPTEASSGDGSTGDTRPDGDGPAGDEAGRDVPPATDARPDMQPRDVGPDLPRNLANGMPCQQNNQCRTGACFDGVCCNVACNNPCQACVMAKTGMPDGRCANNPQMVGMKCGRGCQQFPGQSLLVVVDRVCTSAGQCAFPQIPQTPEYCADSDACTTINCVQDTAYTARCVKTSACTGNSCCCVSGNSRSCMSRSSCTAQGWTCGM